MAKDYLKDLMKKVKEKKEEEAEPSEKQDKQARVSSPNSGSEAEQVKEELAKKMKILSSPSKDTETPAPDASLKAPTIEPEAESAQSLEETVVPDKSEVEKEIEEAPKKIEIASYGKVKIFKIPGKEMLYYYVPVPRPTRAERNVINTIKEAATRLISIAPYKIRDPDQRRVVYRQKIIEILKASPELHIPQHRFEFYAESVVREMVGYGLIDSLVSDDRLEEIMVIGPGKPVYIFHRDYEMMASNIEFFSEDEVQDLINRIARQIGRRVDISSPLLDSRLPDGSRVNATIPPASVSGSTLTIRKFRADPYSMIDLINMGSLGTELAAFLWMAVEGLGARPANILIAGGTGSGKTTTLNVLASFISASERIVTIEDTAELNLPMQHWIRMEARPPGLEGKGELTLDILTKNSLRMRPDRIIVGEVRHDEAFSLFTAMNTGHDGALTSDSLIQLSDGNLVEIGEIVEKSFSQKKPTSENEFEFVELSEKIKVPSLNKKSLKIEHKNITHCWRKKTKENMIRIKLRSGKEICLTKDHPVYKIFNGIQEINSCDAKKGDYLAIPKKISVESKAEVPIPYLVGMVLGDGHLRHGLVEFVNTEDSLIDAFCNEISPLTNNKVSVKDYGNFSRVKVNDTKLSKELNKKYSIPFGNKTKKFKIDKKLLKSTNETISDAVKALFDCEAHVNTKANCIQFSTANKDLALKVPLILMRFGIHSSFYSQEKDGKGNKGPYYWISIYGRDNLEKFRKHICFRHEKKKTKLNELIKKSKNGLDLFPNISNIMRDARIENRITQKELSSLLGTQTRSTVQSYETKARAPSRKKLKQIAGMLSGETAMQLNLLSDSETCFEEIVSIEEEKFEGYVYDLTVEDNHNYIANGFIVSNCLGTVHANSPQETIIRVTNPPMNVPEVMMSGLDLIIIQHRLHSKKQGTIRRFTEVAEVSGVLEGKTQTQTLFDRDPVADDIVRTNIPSNYLRKLQNFTGMTKKQIEKELSERERFLSMLAKKEIRSLEEVSRMCGEFLTERKGE